MQWSQISASEKYKTLTPEQQAKVQDGYFNQYIAPKVEQSGFDPEEARTKFREKIGAAAMPKAETEKPGFFGNMARGIGERASDLAGGFVSAIGSASEAMPTGVAGAPSYAQSMLPERTPEERKATADSANEDAKQLQAVDLGYDEQRNTLDGAKAKLANGDWLDAAIELGAAGINVTGTSLPDMVGAAVAPGLYATARTGELSQSRAENKGMARPTAQEAAEALPFAVAQSALERILPTRLFRGKSDEAATAAKEAVDYAKDTLPKRMAKKAAEGAAIEGATEFIQEGVLEYIGTRYGTDAQMSVQEGLSQGLEAAILGSIGGGALGGIAGIPRQKQPEVQGDESPEDLLQVDPEEQQQQPTAGLEYKPQRMITMPDGTTAWESEADQLRDMSAASRHPSYVRPETPTLNQTPEDIERELGAPTAVDDEIDSELASILAEVESLDRELNPPEAPQIIPGALERGAELAQAEQMAQGPQILPGAMESPAINPEPVETPGQSLQEAQSLQDLASEQVAPTAAQLLVSVPAPQSKPKKPTYLRVNPARDELLTAIAKLGGVSQEEAIAQGIDPAHFRDRVGWNNPFRKQGKTIDEMAEALAQEGYLQESYSANELLDKISNSLSGRKNYTPQGVEFWAEKERFDDDALRALDGNDAQSLSQLVDRGITSTPEADADPAIKALGHLIDDAIEAGASLARIQQITQDKNLTYYQTAGILIGITQEARRANELQNDESGLARSDGPRQSDSAIEGVTTLTGDESSRFLDELFGIESPALTSYTEQDLAARQKADTDRQQAEKLAQSKAEQDAKLSDFTLTGSSRPADLAAARGQNDLFGARNQFPDAGKMIGNLKEKVTSSETDHFPGARKMIGNSKETLTGSPESSSQPIVDNSPQSNTDQIAQPAPAVASTEKAAPKSKPDQEKTGLSSQLAGMSDADLASLIDDVATETEAVETSKPRTKRTKTKTDTAGQKRLKKTATRAETTNIQSPAEVERTATEIAKSLGVNLSSGGVNALQGLTKLFGGNGRMNTGISFDEDTYRKAKPHFQAMLTDFEAAGKDLRELIRAMLNAFGDGVKPYILRFAQDLREAANDTNQGDERGREDRQNEDSDVQGNLQPEQRDEGREDARQAIGGDDQGRPSNAVPDGGATPVRERGAQSSAREDAGDGRRDTGSADDSRGAVDSTGGLLVGRDGDGPAGISIEKAREVESSPKYTPSKTAIKPADSRQIKQQMPFLTDGQVEDVVFAERRLSKPEGYGVLFTNGTGTGKTFTGLGIARRMIDQGKDNIIIVVPKQTIADAWKKAGEKFFNIPIKSLEDKTDNGGKGVVVTTYANFGDNDSLALRNWDAFFLDESHYLSSDQEGSKTKALNMLRSLALKAPAQLAWMKNPELAQKIRSLSEDAAANRKSDNQQQWDIAEKQEAEVRKLSEKMRQAEAAEVARVEAMPKEDMPRAVMLSATPFAYDKNIAYGQGFLFDWGSEKNGLGYNSGNNYQQFMMTHFGYRMRYNKLTRPEGKVDSGLMERNFNAWLKREGVLSGRALDSDFDYDRKFVALNSELGNQIDKAISWLRSFKDSGLPEQYAEAHRQLADQILKGSFDYHARMYLLEAIKADLAKSTIKQHLALGRKVLVMHDFKKGGAANPFGAHVRSGLAKEAAVVYEMFAEQFPKLTTAFTSLPSPTIGLKRAFPDALVYNGDVPAKERVKMQDQFNSDDPDSPALMIAQGDAMREGVSIHDTTGKRQRVLLHLGMPVKPTAAIQQEGRIYRTGQASDAVFRYFTIGTSWERYAFASTIAGRAGTAENLAMGEQARGLKQAFIDAYESADAYPPGHDGEGKGGKSVDAAAAKILTRWDMAKALYFGTKKQGSGRAAKGREGTDYFATPEPIGLKMVEFADIRPGDNVLEPSAGHGAIARWFPEVAKKRAIEPSAELASKLALHLDGDIVEDVFENHHISNKYDAIVMNPPFGHGGKTAIDHLAKAFRHLRDGGRVVALIPTGPTADKHFDRWLYAEDAKGNLELPDAHFVKEVILPPVTFERAGTAAATRIVVIEKWKDGAGPQSRVDLRSAEDIEDLFSRAENLTIKPRAKPVPDDAEGTPAGSQSGKGGRAAVHSNPLQKTERINSALQSLNAARDMARGSAKTSLDGAIRELEEKGDVDGAILMAERAGRVSESPDLSAALEVATKDLKASAGKSDYTIETAFDGVKILVTDAPEVSYTTKKGKDLRGVLVQMPLDKAKEIDKYTWITTIDGVRGAFIRMAHVRRPLSPGDLRQSKGYTERDNNKPKGVPLDQLQQITADFFDRFPGALDGISVRLFGDEARAFGPNLTERDRGKIKGGFNPATGDLVLIAANLDGAADAQEMLQHEILVHHGLGFLPEAQVTEALNTVKKAILEDRQVNKIWQEVEKTYGDKPVADQLEEVLARIAEKLDTGTWARTWNNVLLAIRKALAKLGLIKPLTRLEDLKAIIYDFAQAFEEGKSPGRRDGGIKQSRSDGTDQTETEAFKKWFGDSKVVDENGKPLVVYHGTRRSFDVFEAAHPRGAIGNPKGIYFDSDRSVAEEYAANDDGELDEKSRIIAAYVRVTEDGDGRIKRRMERGRNQVEVIALSPEQIKSATGNTGAFDPDNPDIRFSRRSDSEPRPSAGVSVSERLKKAIPKTKTQKELEQQRAELDTSNRSAFDQLGNKDKTIFQRVRTEIKRQLTPGGLLPKDVFDLKILRDGKMNADEIESRVRIGAFKAAVEKSYGKPYEKLEPAVKARINAALRGEKALVPAAVRDQIGFMRDEIKRLSAIHVQQLMDDIKQLTREAKKQMVKAKEIESESGIDPTKQSGDPDAIREYLDLLGDETKQFSARGKIAEAKKKAALLKTIAENFDTYLHRSYRAFDDPDWPKKVPAKVYAETVDYLAAGYAGDKPVTEDHRDRARKKVAMMLQEGTAFDSMGAFISESKLGAKDLSIIKRRQDIAPQIRALLGEYEDAPVNYTKSVTKMARLVYNHEFLGRMMEIGKAQGFLLEKQNLDLKATKKIAGDASEVYAPLNGLYTYPEFDQALKDALGKENMADWYRAIVAVNGAVKFGKTVLSPTTAMRNFYSAMFFALANGHFDMTQMRKSLGILKTYFRDADDGGKEYMKKLRTLGVIYDSPYASEMMEQLKDSNLEDVERWWNPITRLKAPIDFAQRFYSYGDDFWKIIGFENEKAQLMKHKKMSEQQAEKEAAERIRNTYPTYSMTGRFVNSLRRFPLAGTFVSFPAEIIRTSYHITRYMAQDLKESRAMGMQKLAGYAIAGGAIAGMSALSKAWFNVEDDEEDALKTLAPEWQKNSNFLYWGRDEKGQLRYMDLSFLDPYNYWKRPINAFMRDQDLGEAAVDGTWEMLKPFFGQDILFQAVSESITNKKQTGARVFNPEDEAGNQIWDISKHLGKAVQPGFASNIGRMWDASQGTITSSGKQYSMDEELAGLAGFRLGTFDPKTALYYQTFGFQDRKRSASMLLTSAMRDPNQKSDEDLRDAYERSMTARDRAFRDMLKVVNAAKKAGMTEMQIRVTLKNSGVSKADSAWLARGEAPPWKPSSAMMRGAIKKAAVLFDEETADEFRRREDFIKRLNRDAQK